MKKWFHSKTIWLNIIASLLAILGLFDQKTLLALGLKPEGFLAIIGVATTTLNIMLRILMKKQIGGDKAMQLYQESEGDEGGGGKTLPDEGLAKKPNDDK